LRKIQENQEMDKLIQLENRLRQQMKQNGEQNARISHLEEQNLRLLDSLRSLSKVPSLAPVSGLFNLRSVNEDPEISRLLRGLLISHLETLTKVQRTE